jgi:hypothetical protein
MVVFCLQVGVVVVFRWADLLTAHRVNDIHDSKLLFARVCA